MRSGVSIISRPAPQVANDLCGMVPSYSAGPKASVPATVPPPAPAAVTNPTSKKKEGPGFWQQADQVLQSQQVQNLINQTFQIYGTREARKMLENDATRAETLARLQEQLAAQRGQSMQYAAPTTQNQWLMPAMIGGAALVLILVLKK